MKKQSIQAKFRREVFPFDQYWNISYTEKYGDGQEADFKTFIKAKSYASAKDILESRLKEDDPALKLKAVQGFMFHKSYKSNEKGRLTGQEWEQIRQASFPNVNDVIFKYPVPRAAGKSNRFNATNHEHLKTIGFKSGKENWSRIHKKGKVLAIEDREGMIYKGKWIPWDKELMRKTRQDIIGALVSFDGNRSASAKSLGMSRNKFYVLMSRFPNIDWDKEYPTPKPFSNAKYPSSEVRSAIQKEVMKKKMAEGHKVFQLTEEQERVRLGKMRATKRAQRDARHADMIPKIKNAFERLQNHRVKSAEFLGISLSSLRKLLRGTKHIVDWQKEFPPVLGQHKYLMKYPDHVPTRDIKMFDKASDL